MSESLCPFRHYDDLTEQLRAFAERNGHNVDELRVEVADVQMELAP